MNNDLFRRCAWAGCDERPHRSFTTCMVHTSMHADNTHNGSGRTSHSITDAERSEIIRRMRAFESPVVIARAIGTTKNTVLRVWSRRGAA